MLTEARVLDILVRLGWLAAKAAAPKAINAAVKRFQEFYGLESDGEIGPVTTRAIVDRVNCGCGNRDVENARAGVCQWETANISYYVAATPSGLSEEEARDAYRRAWNSWEEVCGLVVTETANRNQAHVVMDVGRGRRAGFDGRSGTLAWSELPCGTKQVLQRYDLDEVYGTSSAGGRIILENVACHEIGHAIGISHISPSAGRALMNPTYSPNVPAPLGPDIAEAVSRYGKKSATPTLPPTTGKQVVITITDAKLITVDGKPLG